MLPTAYEWHWDLGHLIFMGAFYTVLVAIAGTLSVVAYRTMKNVRRASRIEWIGAFHDLPDSRIKCRYDILDRVGERVCQNGLDCGSCPFHELHGKAADQEETKNTAELHGFEIKPDLKYHRGHTWVRDDGNGVFALGIDDFGARVLGRPDEVILPEVGTELVANSKGFDVRVAGNKISIMSPLDGEVVETGDGTEDWWLKIRATGNPRQLQKLFEGNVAVCWSELELKLLKEHLGIDKSPFPENREGIRPAYPKADWETIWHDVFLNV
ncbi:MAG: hypothetical protein GY854_22135 [Deltaproteobacteria bacterium]|nr:hypothetical protein [Deltaproteobacteria bacterium]